MGKKALGSEQLWRQNFLCISGQILHTFSGLFFLCPFWIPPLVVGKNMETSDAKIFFLQIFQSYHPPNWFFLFYIFRHGSISGSLTGLPKFKIF